MKLSSLIDKNYILVGKEYNNVNEVLDEFIDIFDKKKLLPKPAKEIKKVLVDREQLGGTILPGGVAVPHGRIAGFEDLLIGVCIPNSPIKTDSEEIKILFFILTSKVGSKLYLPLLSSLALEIQDKNFPNNITGLSHTQIHNYFENINLNKEITVGNIMTNNPITCKEDTTLAELADILYLNGLSYIPVVNDYMEQIGEVTIKDLLSEGVPDYVKRLGDVSFMKTLSPFDELLKNEEKINVKKIMRKVTRTIDVNASIIEAVIMITSKRYRHLPVLKDGKLVGVISETDILQKILRG